METLEMDNSLAGKHMEMDTKAWVPCHQDVYWWLFFNANSSRNSDSFLSAYPSILSDYSAKYKDAKTRPDSSFIFNARMCKFVTLSTLFLPANSKW